MTTVSTTRTNRIDKVFKEKKDHILSVYFTAGYPQLEDTTKIMEHLQAAGADLIEIGIPFSDPMADGPTIQDSNQVALKNGMNVNILFQQLKDIRKKIEIPVILMGYFNPVMQYGIERFCSECEKIGIDGLIIPDLPMIDYLELYKNKFDQFGLYNIFLITPQTSDDRIRLIDNNSKGFIYAVSSASITGVKKEITSTQIDYFQRLQDLKLNNPFLIGFGISDRSTFSKASRYASGAIIGSAFIKVLQKSNQLEKDIVAFIKSIKGQ